MSAPDRRHTVEAYLDLARSGSGDHAVQLALAELEAGQDAADVIRGLLSAAQYEAGERWHRGTWTAVDEHRVTALTDAALHLLTVVTVKPAADRGALAVVCAEGDWHTLPARMAADLLRLQGWDVMFLGGSLPASDLARWMRAARPDGLVVTCSMPGGARGVLNIAMAADRIGIPVVAGGRGMGPDGRRAAALGVRWVPELSRIQAALATPAPRVGPGDLAERIADDDEAALHRGDVIDLALHQLHRDYASTTLLDPLLACVIDALGPIFDAVAAAALTRDPRLLTHFLDWLTGLFTARQVPRTAVAACLDALSAAMPQDLRPAAAVLSAATKQAHRTLR